MIDGQSCGTCTHFYSNPEDKVPNKELQGQCRHDPPHIVVLQGEAMEPKFADGGRGRIESVSKQQVSMPRSMFAPMLARDPGCGQYKRAFSDPVL